MHSNEKREMVAYTISSHFFIKISLISDEAIGLRRCLTWTAIQNDYEAYITFILFYEMHEMFHSTNDRVGKL